MKDSLYPTSGGRVVLALTGQSDASVTYRASLYVPARLHESDVTVRVADGEVVFGPWAPVDPPAWLAAFARAFLRSAWLARRDEPGAAWPDRLNRWRAAK